MSNTMRAALIAPTPIFVILLLLFISPSLGWLDAVATVGIALACSYGFMLAVGLPTHLMLHRMGWQDWTQYVLGFLLALGLVILMLTAVEGSPQPSLLDDNSPFAALTLRGGGWLLMFVLCSPLVLIMASIFWQQIVRVED